VLDDLIEHFDEPFADASAIPTWYVSQMARRHVTVVLSGDGGDELFAGYDRYLVHPRVEQFDRWSGRIGRAMAGAAWRALPHGTRGKNFLRHVSRDPRGRYLDSVSFFQADEKRALLSTDLLTAIDRRSAQETEQRFDRFAALPWSGQMMRFDFETYLPEDILTKVDRMSMAHSIESRVPLLDHEFVSLASSLPSHFKIQGRDRKRILKRVAARHLPPDVLQRPKRGFGVPLDVWFRGQLRDACHDVLSSSRTRQRGYFDHRFVDRLLEEHMQKRRDHTLRLWQLMVFELWHRKYLDQDTSNGFHERDTRFPFTPDQLPNKDKPLTA
jgi:asparagine synthase (glutamine-hydrolysing)